MNILSVFGIVFLCVISAIVLRETGAYTVGLFLVCFVIAGVGVISVSSLSSSINELLSSVNNLPFKHSDVVLKSFGIAFVGEIGADIIHELGSENVAKYFLLFAKVEILCLCLAPMYELLDFLFELSRQAFG